MRLYMVFILSLLFVSCKSEEPTLEQEITLDTSVIMPLKVGNTWLYRTVILDTSGNVLSTVHDTVAIVRDTTIGQERWLVNNLGSHYTNRTDGLWGTIQSGSQPIQFVHLAKYPASTNERYPMDPNLYYWHWIRVLSVDSVATVPLGQFRSYVYESGALGSLFYVPGLGQIMNLRDGGLSRRELLAVHVN